MLFSNDKVDENSKYDDVRNHLHLASSDVDTPSTKVMSHQEEEEEEKRENDNKGKQPPETKIVYGEKTAQVIHEFGLNCKSEYSVCIDKNGPSIIIDVPSLNSLYTIFKNNSIKIRLVTEITQDNIRFCKQVMEEFGAEIKHLEGLKGNFGISDGKVYIASAVLEESKPLTELIYSNVKGVVEQNQYLFETLWKKAIPAEQRIREIEEGLLPVETYLIDNPAEILDYALDLVNNVNIGLSNCTSISYFKVLDYSKPLLQVYLNLLSRQREGNIKDGVRWLTYIDNKKEDVELIEKFLSIGIKIKHSSRLPPLNFSLSERQFVWTVEKLVDGKMFEKLLHSTEPLYMRHFQSIFEELWEEGIDAHERIRRIQSGIASETTKVIENPIQTKEIFLHLLKNAHKEIMIIFPSFNSVKRKGEIGLFDLLRQKRSEKLRFRILTPFAGKVKEILLLKNAKEKVDQRENMIIKEIEKQQDIRSTILIVDKKFLLTIEHKDDTKEILEEAIGPSTYSTSQPTLSSYISIFESLWIQTEMFENVRMANEKLIQSEEMEKEFLNTAAHELRTPTQAIMGYVELDEEVFDDILKNPKVKADVELKRIIGLLYKHFDIISRNASRLDDLINNLLDVAKIESNINNSLSLQKERLDLVKEIKEAIKTQLLQKIKSKNIAINFINDSLEEQCWVYADKSRLNQIVNNLIDNAIKFSNQNGRIDIIIKENISHSNDRDVVKKKNIVRGIQNDIKKIREKRETEEIFVGISDSGKGISSQVMPNLFQKFITDSDTGTGLGLFITRNLVEAHGGRIWAFNNNDGVGSTFVFSLPKADDSVLESD